MMSESDSDRPGPRRGATGTMGCARWGIADGAMRASRHGVKG
jgi:hypothetical protein